MQNTMEMKTSTGIPMQNTIEMKTSAKTKNGLIQMIRMDKSTGQKRVKPVVF